MRTVRRSASGFQADLGAVAPRRRRAARARARACPSRGPGLGIDVGNPHVVVALADDAELDGLDLAYQPVLDPLPEDGANVEFVVPADPLVEDGVGRIRMRVHERGSGETLSCGTGAVAAALAVRHWAGAGGPERLAGRRCPAACSASACSRPTTASTSPSRGPAELVFDGVLSLA